MRGYSQLGQDRFALQVLGFAREGFFVDSGASDGITASNTYLLETQYDWRGICVEPNARFFAQLVKIRRASCIDCCLFDSEGTVEFFEGGTLGGVLADYPPQLLAHAARAYPDVKNANGDPAAVLKPSRTIASVLAQFKAPPIIDYWSLDTEGSELRILQSFPFDRHRVRVITVEHNRYPVRVEIQRFLHARGYVHARDFGIDDGYVEASLAAEGSAQLRWRRRRNL